MAEKARIMIVDDEKGMRDFLRYLLEGEGYHVAHAANGAEALTKLKQDSTDLILADIKMPGMDGLEMLRQIKEIDPNIVVIVMTGYSSLETAIKAIKYNAHNYLTKPFDDPDAVLAAVENGLVERDEALT